MPDAIKPPIPFPIARIRRPDPARPDPDTPSLPPAAVIRLPRRPQVPERFQGVRRAA